MAPLSSLSSQVYRLRREIGGIWRNPPDGLVEGIDVAGLAGEVKSLEILGDLRIIEMKGRPEAEGAAPCDAGGRGSSATRCRFWRQSRRCNRAEQANTEAF